MHNLAAVDELAELRWVKSKYKLANLKLMEAAKFVVERFDFFKWDGSNDAKVYSRTGPFKLTVMESSAKIDLL